MFDNIVNTRINYLLNKNTTTNRVMFHCSDNELRLNLFFSSVTKAVLKYTAS